MTTEHIEKFWRDATAADVVDVMNSKEVEARFRDDEHDPWRDHGNLTGFKAVGENKLRWFTRTASWRSCQVYDPPQWFLDNPDPGEGFRLLGKFPDEALQPGDEVRKADRWEISGGAELGQTQLPFLWYRRRIEQSKPEPKHYSLQVGDTADVPSGHRITITEHGVEVT